MLKKSKSFHLSFQVILRLLIFSLVVYFSIIYLSGSNKPNIPSVLGETTTPLYDRLPPASRSALENLSSSPAIIFVQNKIELLKVETADFPQKQIRDIQKAVINKLYSNIIKNIDQP
jgi:hypothetical protein